MNCNERADNMNKRKLNTTSQDKEAAKIEEDKIWRKTTSFPGPLVPTIRMVAL